MILYLFFIIKELLKNIIYASKQHKNKNISKNLNSESFIS
jgi:hypothetical protein